MLQNRTGRCVQLTQPCRHSPRPHSARARSRHQHVVRYYMPDQVADVLWRLVPGTMLSGLVTASSAVASQLSKRAASNAFSQEVCRLFHVSNKEELQDTLAALVLSECVYKKMEMSSEDMVGKITEFLSDFPAELVHLEAVQPSLNDLSQNYLVAVGSKSVYVAFMGTKQARDVLTDAAFFHEAIWRESPGKEAPMQVPTAHRGFLARSKSIDVEALYQMALDSNRHLVLCGHSLGGAVAKLCTLRLLRTLPEWPPPQLRCICFAAPAVGNRALAQLVETAGWDSYFKTYALPEDQLMQVLTTWWQEPAPVPTGPSAGTGTTTTGPAPAAAPVSETAARPASSSTAATGGAGAAGSAGNGKDVVTAVADVLALPFKRESAKQQLRRELQAEERSTTMQDAAALDAADASAASGSAAVASYDSASLPDGTLGPVLPVEAAVGAPQAGAAAAAAAMGPLTEQQAQEVDEAERSVAADAGRSSAGSSARTALQLLSNHVALVPQHAGVLLDLQRRWTVYQMARMGKAAQDSFSTTSRVVSSFCPFGQHWYISSEGVVPMTTLPPKAHQPSSPDAQEFLAQNPGLFSFHRMVAYRHRSLALIRSVRLLLEVQGLHLPPAPRVAGPVRPVQLAPVVPHLQVLNAAVRLPLTVPYGLAPLRTPPATAAGGPDGPAMAAKLLPAAGGAAGAADAPQNTSSSSAGSSWRGPLAFLPGGRKTEELVTLNVSVKGVNLHQAKYMSLSVFGEAYVPVDTSQVALTSSVPAVAASSSPNSSSGSGSSPAGAGTGSQLGRFAAIPAVSYMLRGVQQAHVALSRIAEGGRPAWKPPVGQVAELQLQVQLPQSTVARLCGGAVLAAAAATVSNRQRRAAAAAAPASRLAEMQGHSRSTGAAAELESSSACGWRAAMQQQQHQSWAKLPVAGPQQQQLHAEQAVPAAPALLLRLRSDFETVAVEVAVMPYRVGVVGSTKEAAAVVQLLLLGVMQVQSAASQAAEEALAVDGAAKPNMGPAQAFFAWAAPVQAAAAKLLSFPQQRLQVGGRPNQVQEVQPQAQQQQGQVPTAGVPADHSTPQQSAPAGAAAGELRLSRPQPQLDGTPVRPGVLSGNAADSFFPDWTDPWMERDRLRPPPATAVAAAAGMAAAALLPMVRAPVVASASTVPATGMGMQQQPQQDPASSPRAATQQLATTWWQRLASGSAAHTVAVAQTARVVNGAAARVVQLPKRLLEDRAAVQAVQQPLPLQQQEPSSKRQRVSPEGSSTAGTTAVSTSTGPSAAAGSSQPAGAQSSSMDVTGPACPVTRGIGSSSSSIASHPLRLQRPVLKAPLPRQSARSAGAGGKRSSGLSVAVQPHAAGSTRGRDRSDLRPTAAAVVHPVDMDGQDAPAAEVQQQQAAGAVRAAAAADRAVQPRMLQHLASGLAKAAGGVAEGLQAAANAAGTALRGNSGGSPNAPAGHAAAQITGTGSGQPARGAAAAAAAAVHAPHVLVGVLYQTLPGVASRAAKCATAGPRQGLFGFGGRGSRKAAAQKEASLQQVLRLASRQLLRSQASSWSWAGWQGWAPGAVRGLAGMVSNSWSRGDLRAASDTWAGWKGGIMSGGGLRLGGSSSSSPGSGSTRPAQGSSGGVAGGALAPAPQGQPQQPVLMQQRVEASAFMDGSRLAVGGGQAWDVLLLVATWDASFPALLAEPSLSTLVSAAEAAGVPLVPVLVQQGPETVLVTQTPKRSASPQPQRGNAEGSGSTVQIWRWEEAAQQLADACGVTVARVCQLQLGMPLASALAEPTALASGGAHQQQLLQQQLMQLSGVVSAQLQERYGMPSAHPQRSHL